MAKVQVAGGGKLILLSLLGFYVINNIGLMVMQSG
jgi:hypothetical protein